MKITFEPARRVEKGYALVITMLFLVVAVIALTSMWLWTANNGSVTQRNIIFNESSAAAEAATEKVFTTMDRDFLFGNLGTSNTYNTLIPDTSNTNLWPVQYTFSDTNGNANTTYVNLGVTNFEVLNSQYAGLQGIAQDCTIISVATPVGLRYTVPATVSQSFQAAQIPIFQFAIFYNLNMEIAPGQAQNVIGRVFCNASIWAGASDLTFASTVQAVGTVNTTTTDPFSGNYTDTGNPTFTLGGQPTSGNDALTMPIGTSTNTNPTNIEAILNLPPAGLGAPNTTAYAESNQVYLFNESDIIISNASWGINGVAFEGLVGGTNSTTVNTEATNFTVWFQDRYHIPVLTKITNDYIKLKFTTGNFTNTTTHTGGLNITNFATTNILYAGYSFLTNTIFYDWREGWNSGSPKAVQAVQIDVARFQRWLTNGSGIGSGNQANQTILADLVHGIGSIYVYNNVPLTSTTLPAGRLINGSMLPTNYPGLTVSTPQPLYIYGDYNISNNIPGNIGNNLGANITTHTQPAAVMADAITVLSDGWNDSTVTAKPSGATTTVNAAMLEGIVQTVATATTQATGYYSGGVENFMRLLEDWTAGGGQTLTYNGSIVVMFPSIYATNYWQPTGNYYNAPTRHWAFDNNFTNATGLPPLTPKSRALIRGSWSSY
jgi:hypothetical protein